MEQKQLLELVQQTGSVYRAIAEKIELLIGTLNETEGEAGTAELAEKIEQFLAALLKSIKAEKRSAKELSSPSKKKIILLIKKELGDIKRLTAFVRLSKKKSTPAVITAIHQLYQVITIDIAAEEAVLKD